MAWFLLLYKKEFKQGTHSLKQNCFPKILITSNKKPKATDSKLKKNLTSKHRTVMSDESLEWKY